MSALLLVAAREFRQICTTRSFWITLLLLPMALVLSQVSARMFQPAPGVAFATGMSWESWALMHRNGKSSPLDLALSGRRVPTSSRQQTWPRSKPPAD
jgi:hypothetical protein